MAPRPENLTVDYKKLLRMTTSERVALARSPIGQSYLGALTPSQYAALFPDYYKKFVPSHSSIQSGGGGGGGGVSAGGGGGYVGGGGGVSAGGGGTTETPTTTPPTATQPQQSSAYVSSAVSKLQAAMEKEGVAIPQAPQAAAAPTTTTAVLGGNSLKAVRSRQMKELENPEVRAAVLARAEIEVGGQPKAQKGWMETLFNRAAAAKISLYDAVAYNQNHPTGKHKYYPNKDQSRWESMRKSLPKGVDSKFSGHLSSVGGGSNETDYATDNASGTLAQQRYARFGGKYVNGELYYNNGDVPAYSNWARQQRKADAEEASRPTDAATGVQTGPNQTGQTMPEGTLGPGAAISPRQGGGKGVATGEGDLYSIAQSKRPSKEFKNFEVKGGLSKCGMGTGAVVDAMFGTSYTSGGIGADAGGFAGKNAKAFLPQLYGGPQAASAEYMNDPSQWRIGDVIASKGGKRGIGHIQTWNGKQWVSDHKQPKIYQDNYSDFTLHRVKPESYNNISAEYLKSMDSNNATNKYIQSLSGKIEPGSNAQQSATGDFPASTQASQNVKQNIKEFPQGFLESLPENSRAAISGLSENERNKVAELVSASYDKHGAEKTATIVQGIFDQKPSQQAAAATLVNTPLDKLPEVNPEGFGLGKVHGKRVYSNEEIAQREAQQTGMFSFEGFGDEFKGLQIPVASGGSKGAASIAPGTYMLSPQALGKTIKGYYKRTGVPTEGAFAGVYNIGLPGSPTNIGVDPKTGKQRQAMQIHSGHIQVDDFDDIEKLTSLGCIKPGVNQYKQLKEAVDKAYKLTGGKLAIQVLPGNKPGEQIYKVMPAGLATNPISVTEAVQQTQDTGLTVTGDPVNTTTTTTSSTGVDTSQIIPNPNGPLPSGDTAMKLKENYKATVLHISPDSLGKLQKGEHPEGPSFGYHTAVMSTFRDAQGNEISEKEYNKLSSSQKKQYTEISRMHEIRPETARPNQVISESRAQGGEGKFEAQREQYAPQHAHIRNWNAYSIVDPQGSGVLSQSKQAAIAEHMAQMVASGRLPEEALNFVGHGEIQGNRASGIWEGNPEMGEAAKLMRGRVSEIKNRVREIQTQSTTQPIAQQPVTGQVMPEPDLGPSAAPAPDQKPKEEAPTATPAPEEKVPELSTGGTVTPGENITAIGEDGSVKFRMNERESLRVDPATLTDPQTQRETVQQFAVQKQEQEQPQIEVARTPASMRQEPSRPSMGMDKIVHSVTSVATHSPSAHRAYDRARFFKEEERHYGYGAGSSRLV